MNPRTSHNIASELISKGLAKRIDGNGIFPHDPRHSLYREFERLQRAEIAACPFDTSECPPAEMPARRAQCTCGYHR